MAKEANNKKLLAEAGERNEILSAQFNAAMGTIEALKTRVVEKEFEIIDLKAQLEMSQAQVQAQRAAVPDEVVAE